MSKKKYELYMHVGNSGVTFSVINGNNGPEIKIKTSAFANLVNEQTIYTTKEGLKKLGKLFLEASEDDYSEEYCHAAKPR